MADNNLAQRQALARYLGNVVARTFTSSVTIGTAATALACYLGPMNESDQLEIAGRDRVRGQVMGLTAASLTAAGISYDEGTMLVLDGDVNWGIQKWRFSPDGAEVLFSIISTD